MIAFDEITHLVSFNFWRWIKKLTLTALHFIGVRCTTLVTELVATIARNVHAATDKLDHVPSKGNICVRESIIYDHMMMCSVTKFVLTRIQQFFSGNSLLL